MIIVANRMLKIPKRLDNIKKLNNFIGPYHWSEKIDGFQISYAGHVPEHFVSGSSWSILKSNGNMKSLAKSVIISILMALIWSLLRKCLSTTLSIFISEGLARKINMLFSPLNLIQFMINGQCCAIR